MRTCDCYWVGAGHSQGLRLVVAWLGGDASLLQLSGCSVCIIILIPTGDVGVDALAHRRGSKAGQYQDVLGTIPQCIWLERLDVLDHSIMCLVLFIDAVFFESGKARVLGGCGMPGISINVI